MTLQDYQQQVDVWTKQFKQPYFPIFEILAEMQEELGELSRETSHLFGTKKKKVDEPIKSLESELGDLLFSVICYANSQKINLDDCFRLAINKAYDRDNDRYPRICEVKCH